jgi:hypothetical protein
VTVVVERVEAKAGEKITQRGRVLRGNAEKTVCGTSAGCWV